MPENLGSTTGANFGVVRDLTQPTNIPGMLSTDPGNLLAVGTDGKIMYERQPEVGVPQTCNSFPWGSVCATDNVFPTGGELRYVNWSEYWGAAPIGASLAWNGEELVETIPPMVGLSVAEFALFGGVGFVGPYGPHPDPWEGDADPYHDFCVHLEKTVPTVPMIGKSWAEGNFTGTITGFNVMTWMPWQYYLGGHDGFSFMPDANFSGCVGVTREAADYWFGERVTVTPAAGAWIYLSLGVITVNVGRYGVYNLFVTTAEATIRQTFKWSRANWNYPPATGVLTKDRGAWGDPADPRVAATARVAMDFVRYQPMLRMGPKGHRFLTRNVPTFRDMTVPGSDAMLATEYLREQITEIAAPEVEPEEVPGWQF